MDNLTHGLLGLAVGALRRPDAGTSPLSPTDKAVLLGCALAAELPDLDNLLPAENSVVHALQAHRGLSHALVFAPVVALAATAVARLVFRRARTLPVFGFSLLSVVAAHLLADLWTGWGTRVLLPFSDTRLTLDWTMVVDPWVTLPLLAGAIVALRQRARWRRAVLLGATLSAAYIGTRVVLHTMLTREVRSAYPAAERVQVFPAWLSVTTWRYVAVVSDEYVAGTVSVAGPPREEARQPVSTPDALPGAVREVATVREALAWARFPVVRTTPAEAAGMEVRIADLRYHLHGRPTLEFVLTLGPDLRVRQARLERGGTARDLLRRWLNPTPGPATPGS